LAWYIYLQGYFARKADQARQAVLDKQALDTLVLDIDQLHAKLNRTPRNQDELEMELGRALPKIHEDGYPRSVHYYSRNAQSYYIVAGDWYYDSDKRDVGWELHDD
jgi:hypothetical protein